MAHIPDGVASLPVLIVGATVSLAGCAYALKKMDMDRIPQVAMVAAILFVASLVRVPLGPSSVHLLLSGLCGVLLGARAFPAFGVALVLQMVMFGFGGVSSLGVNVMNMALPAAICGFLFGYMRRIFADTMKSAIIAAGLCGGLGVMLTSLGVSLSLYFSGQEFMLGAKLIFASHVPLAIVEGVVTGFIVSMVYKLKPDYVMPIMAEGKA